MEKERLEKVHRTLKDIGKDITDHKLDNYGLSWWDDNKRVEDVDALVNDLKELRDEHNFTSQGMNEWLVLLEYAQAAHHKGINREKAEADLKKRDPKEVERLNYYLDKLVHDLLAYKLYGVGMQILKRNGFPIIRYSEEARFMAQHPGDLRIILEAIPSNDSINFCDTLLHFRQFGLINTKYWSGLIDIVRYVDDYQISGVIFGLRNCFGSGLLRNENWSEIVKGFIIILKNVSYSKTIFRKGFQELKEHGLLEMQYWPGLILLAKTFGNSSNYLFSNTLIELQRVDFPKTKGWSMIVEGLQKLELIPNKVSGVTSNDIRIPLFIKVLPLIVNSGIINENSWFQIIDDIIKLSSATERYGYSFFNQGFPRIMQLGIIDNQFWPQLVKDIINMSHSTRKESSTFFLNALPSVLDSGLIQEFKYKLVVNDLAAKIKLLEKQDSEKKDHPKEILTLDENQKERAKEKWKILVSFVTGKIKNSKQKMNVLMHFEKIPRSILRRYSDFIYFLMENQPSFLFTFLRSARKISLLKISLSKDILQFTRLTSLLRLEPEEFPSDNKKQELVRVYAFLLGKKEPKKLGLIPDKNKIEKFRRMVEDLSDHNLSRRNIAREKIINTITPC
ncbi:MAG: hypothetical protein QF632_06625 [Candidatus Woesearchaeota archaeon]|jgi:hypothetical protein|nr:hypothetical protein [Candidatus Woesearchaeota archaeon]MDP7458041.1 hypothetical protein [Candidatus Woesearchaeota archaeon]